MTTPEHQFRNTAPTSEHPPIRVQSLGSGSSGNAFLIDHGTSSLLIDCGVGIRTISRIMKERQRAIADLDAVLISHEHIDHIRTLPQVIGSDMPVIASRGTYDRTRIPNQQWLSITPSAPVTIAGASVWALPVEHDAAEPCGFLIELPAATITILTDLGSWRENLLEPLVSSDLIVLESNHDLEMLRRGPYPPHLKRRIASAVGHLSNETSAGILAEVASSGGRDPDVWLAHLSATNNRPEVATGTVLGALDRIDRKLTVTALPRRSPGPIWTSGGSGANAARQSRPIAQQASPLPFDGF